MGCGNRQIFWGTELLFLDIYSDFLFPFHCCKNNAGVTVFFIEYTN
jgi:hypothetical protein